jgi:hypothetical protein
VKTVSQPFDDLPDPSCRDSGSCPASVLITGKDRSFGESMCCHNTTQCILAVHN